MDVESGATSQFSSFNAVGEVRADRQTDETQYPFKCMRQNFSVMKYLTLRALCLRRMKELAIEIIYMKWGFWGQVDTSTGWDLGTVSLNPGTCTNFEQINQNVVIQYQI